MGKKMSWLDCLAMVLLIVGGLNWGLVGILKFDLVATLFGDMSVLSRIVYSLVGLAAVWGIVMMAKKKGGAKKPEAPAVKVTKGKG